MAVASWSFGASNPTSVGSSGMSAGRVAATPAAEPVLGGSGFVTVSKAYDKTSPVLSKACANGQHIGRAQLTRCVDGACRSYRLDDVVISSITLANDGRGKATREPEPQLREGRSRARSGQRGARESVATIGRRKHAGEAEAAMTV